MELKKQKILFIVILILLIISNSKIVFAVNEPAENDRGICDAWFSKDGLTWENTTAKASLKLGQPFYVKIMVKAKTNLKFLRYQMSCYGPPYDFELAEIPSDLPDNSQILEYSTGRTIVNVAFSDVKGDEEYIHIWMLRVKPNSSFSGGNTPINLDSFFFNGENEEQMLFTVSSISIADELYKENPASGDSSNFEIANVNQNNTPVFEILVIILLLLLLLFLRSKK